MEEALNVLLEEVRANPQQILQSDAEDIHSWVEGKLIDKVGQLGKKLHTGRSRNDQVATDMKLWCKETVGNCSPLTVSYRARWWKPRRRTRTR